VTLGSALTTSQGIAISGLFSNHGISGLRYRRDPGIRDPGIAVTTLHRSAIYYTTVPQREEKQTYEPKLKLSAAEPSHREEVELGVIAVRAKQQ